MSTEELFLRDAYLRSARAEVTGVDGTDGVQRVALDRTVLYPTGGGQPHDTGVLRWAGGEAAVVGVRKEGQHVWHAIGDGAPVPEAGTGVEVALDWDRRHSLMRTHVRSTGEIGGVRVVKTQSKGKGNKRVRIEVTEG